MQARDVQLLTEGQLQQLQWVLPTAFNAQLRAFLGSTAVVGAKLRITIEGCEHWLGIFDPERMLDEVLRAPSATSATFTRLLPFAGCGRRRTRLYLVDVVDSNVWVLESKQPAPVRLGITMTELWKAAAVEPRVIVRKRLPLRPQKSLRRATGPTPQKPRTETPCARTLSLFPVN